MACPDDELPPPTPRKARPDRFPSDPDWHFLTRQLGVRARRLRCVLGVSQQKIATAARVSQGGVSRIESGQCHSTPLISYVKLFGTLVRGLEALGTDLPRETREFLVAVRALVPEVLSTHTDPLENQPLATLLATLAALTPERQAVFYTLVQPLAEYLRRETLTDPPGGAAAGAVAPALTTG